MKFKVSAFGLACGVTWALFLFLVAIVAMLSPYWGDAVTWVGNFYIGYDATIGGAFIGAIWAFVDGFIGGAVFAWLYNLFSK